MKGSHLNAYVVVKTSKFSGDVALLLLCRVLQKMRAARLVFLV